MIYFEKIKWTNFLSTGNYATEIDLEGHAKTVVLGVNGSGKSTLLDAIDYVLFNKPYRNINKPNLINSINGKDCLVEIWFRVGSDKYLIKRGMKPFIFEIYKNDIIVNQDAAARDYQEWLEKTVLKTTYRAFNQIAILGSATHVPFMQLPTYQRREFSENLLNITIFSKMNTLLKARQIEVERSIEKMTFDMKLVMEKAKETIAYIDKQKNASVEKKAAAVAQIESYQNSITAYEGDSVVLSNKLSILDGDILNLLKGVNDESSILSEIKTSATVIKGLTKEVDFFTDNDHCPKCTQTISPERKDTCILHAENEKKTLNDRVSELNISLAKIRTIQEEIKKLESDRNKVRSDIDTIEREIVIINDRIKTLQADIDNTSTVDLEQENAKLKQYRLDHTIFNKSKEELMVKNSVYATCLSLLKDEGIKSAIIKKYIPIFNKLINKYLAGMDFFVNFELDETFKETIKSRFRDTFTYENFSEGEKQKIDLALLFTWRDVARMNNSMATNLLIMDEIFDSSLDANGTEELTKILFTSLKDVNLFIISHKTDLLADKFSNVLRFEKVKNFSRIAA